MFKLTSFLFLITSSILVAVQGQTYQPAGPNAGNWKLLGCANDLYPNARALNAAYSESPNGQSTSISSCIAFCDSQGAYLSGIEYGYQCFCGPSLDNGSKINVNASSISSKNNGGCSTTCKGDSSQNCGGPNALLVFQNIKHSAPSVKQLSGQTYKGCFGDNTNNRLLPYVYQGNSNPSMTPDLCASGCTSRGYDLSGTEYREYNMIK
jgi:WSC domain